MRGIDPVAVQVELTARLPLRAKWLLHAVPLEFDFARVRRPLRAFTPEDITGGQPEEAWLSLLLIGDTNYSDGGGSRWFLGVHQRTGEVHGLDVELDGAPLFLLNTSVDRFVRTFELLDAALRQGKGDVACLADSAERFDPEGYPRSNWRKLVEHVQRNPYER